MSTSTPPTNTTATPTAHSRNNNTTTANDNHSQPFNDNATTTSQHPPSSASLLHATFALADPDLASTFDSDSDSESIHEASAFLHPMDSEQERHKEDQAGAALGQAAEKTLPWWKRKRWMVGIGGGAVVLVLLIVLLAVYGARGELGGKGESGSEGTGGDGEADKGRTRDGLSKPWYPTPRGGTTGGWAESYEKARELVSKMSLVEKVNITTGVGWQMGLCVGNTGPATSVGFPSLCLQDGPLGLRFADNITAFPAGITVGATWSHDLMYKRGLALGKEAQLKGVNVILGPAMGPIGVLPAGGRNWEGFGSDPVLQGIAAAQTIRGIQENGVMATAKHYVLNEQEHYRQTSEWGLANAMSSNIDDRSLREVYVWPFAESVRAGVASVMCAYQMVNNSYSCANSMLMNGILKDELGFQGFVQSDWLAQRSGVASALAGLDMSMPGDGLGWADGLALWGSSLTQAALNTSVPMERLNDMVTRVVASWYQMKQDSWPNPPPDGDGGPNFSSWTDDKIGRLHQGSPDDDAEGVVNKFIKAQGEGKDAHHLLARQIAAESTILVKNVEDFLPLSRDGPKISDKKYRVGIYGEDAGAGKGPNFCPNRACNQGTLGSGWGSGAVDFPYLITPWKALNNEFNNQSVVVDGYLTNNSTENLDIEDLQNKDLCLVFANADSGEGFDQYNDIRGDRNDLVLQKGTDKIIPNVATQCGGGNGSTVVIVHSVGPVLLDPWIDIPGIKAVVLANLPGQESGNALADVLFGDVNPSGRLPYTIGKSLADYGPEAGVLYKSDDPIPQKDFSHGLYIDYRYFDKHNITPRFEFGYGLSYTTFNFSKVSITPLKEKSPLPSPRPEQRDPPSFNNTVPDPETALFPQGFRKLAKYVYPYISSTKDIKKAAYNYPIGYNTTQPPSPAGGGEGGNPSLFEPFLTVNATLTNTGPRLGKDVVQVYVSFPANVIDKDEHGREIPVEFPVRVLRNFQKVEVQPGQSVDVGMEITRKDLSYWSVTRQNWVMPVEGRFRVWVGRSSRGLGVAGEF
ncbi:hypothetical protein FQN51_004614 [Onygenales sp. PD_10]|nr:hypothetical protein FQN51_004614 [Onygenales sp. PD_10]